jgi:hypothetical protein
MRGIVVSGLLAGAAVWCQSTVGSANGQPLMSKVPERTSVIGAFWITNGRAPTDEIEIQAAMTRRQCEDLRGQIMAAVVHTEKERFGIAVSAAEGAALSKVYWELHDPESEAAKRRSNAQALEAALVQVYEQGKAAEFVYQQSVASSGMPRAVWESNLELGRNADFRANLKKTANISAQAVMKSTDKANVALIERRKLDQAVDNELAIQDSEFGKYVDLLHRSTHEMNPFESQMSAVPSAQLKYILRKRAEWWQNRYSETKVVINDPLLRQRCQLGTFE